MRHNWLDGMAIGASALCLLHCLALPFLLVALPTLALTLGTDDSVHIAVLAFAVPTSGYALISGLGSHRRMMPLVAGLTGLILLSVGLWLERIPEIGVYITVLGSLFLAYGHVANWRLRSQTASRFQ